MGTNVTLDIGNFSLQTGRNEYYEHHGDLFLPTDVIEVVEDGEARLCQRRVFSSVLERLCLLGVHERSVIAEYEAMGTRHYFIHPETEEHVALDFCRFAAMIRSVDVENDSDAFIYSELDGYEHYFRKVLAPRAGIELVDGEDNAAFEALSVLSAYAMLWLLSKNSVNLHYTVTWDYGLHVQTGWSTAQEHIRPLRIEDRFLIVTEGKSDTNVLSRAFELRQPETADFFYFIDASNGNFPYTGSALVPFCKALTNINIVNQTIVAFDNDAAGCEALSSLQNLKLPTSTRFIKLPDLPAESMFETIGPDGSSHVGINGTAASIEAYLDVDKIEGTRVRWAAYRPGINRYQGAIENKSAHVDRFLDPAMNDEEYNFNGVDLILASIAKTAKEIACARALAIRR